MLSFVIGRPFRFPEIFPNLFGMSIRTSMQNMDSVAQEMSELCSILRFGGHFFKIQNLLGLSVQTYKRNLDSVAQEMSEL